MCAEERKVSLRCLLCKLAQRKDIASGLMILDGYYFAIAKGFHTRALDV
jgi:hypothetical protein